MATSPAGFKTALQLYRDCLRVVKLVAGESPKGMAMKAMVRAEFMKNANETDPDKIEDLKFNAVRALSNYSLYNAASKDPQMKARMKKRQEAIDEEERNRGKK